MSISREDGIERFLRIARRIQDDDRGHRLISHERPEVLRPAGEEDNVPDLRAEIERLRGLLESASDWRRDHLLVCPYCHGKDDADHSASCPQPAIEAAVLSWRPAGGR